MGVSTQFDAGCVVAAGSQSVVVMVEMYCTDNPAKTGNSTVEDFPLPDGVVVDSVSGTLSFYGLNWSWWKRLLRWFGFLGGQSTAICGTVGTADSSLLLFDIQGIGSEPQTIPVKADFPGGVALGTFLRFNIYPDMAMPTDFRIALSFHRKV